LIIATVYVTLAAHVRRLHDIERSRRTRIMPFVPFLGAVILLFIPGDAEPNDHGPPRGFFERRR